MFLCACSKSETPVPPGLASLTTAAVGTISPDTAVSGGTIIVDGGSPVTARGVCWGTSSNPTITGNKSSDGTGIGSFTSSLTGLVSNSTYYVRAYATNNLGTAYGNQISFTTPPDVYVAGYDNLFAK